MSEPVIFYAVMKSWMWAAYPVIKESESMITFQASGIKNRRVRKVSPMFRFGSLEAAQAACEKLKQLDRDHKSEWSSLRLRQSEEINALAEQLGADA